MGLKWVVVFVLLEISLQNAHAALSAQVFTASSKSIVFQWNKVTGAISYEITIARKDNANQPLAFATFGANTVMGSVHTGLSPNTNYTFTVSAKDSTGAVLESSSGEHMTAPDVVDSVVSVTPKDSTTLQMEFVPKAGVSKYIIRALDTQNPPNFLKEVEVTSSPALVPLLQPYTAYQLSIMAANSGGRSQPTAPVTAKTLLPPPQVQSSSPSNSTIDLTWAPVPSAVLYSVCLHKYNTSGSQKFTQNTTGTALSFNGLDPGTLYLIQSYAWDIEGRKGQSATTNQTTRPPAPASVTVTMVTNSSLALSVSWTMAPDVFGKVRYSVSTNAGVSCNSSSLSCALSPVTCGSVYSVEVTAQNDAGPSVPSGAVSFTTIPCPPQDLVVAETTPGNCSFSWNTVAHADSYIAYVKNADGLEKTCNTTGSRCDFSCECGYTFLMSVFAVNGAGSSQPGPMINYTTVPCCPSSMNVSLVSADTLEVEWLPARGAELYETRAEDNTRTILCNDTAPVCVLSYLSCDRTYSVKVLPCNDISGCNYNCPASSKDTAACTPTGLTLTPVNSTALSVNWTSTNRAATFTVTATGGDTRSCSTGGSSCDLTGLPCGSTYEVDVTATSTAGESLPSYSELYETEPCCPSSLRVDQVTQAMTNVSWSSAKGAHTFLTALTSSKGYARCRTEDTHCIMGCITCSTSYTVTMEAYSLSGLKTNCSYQGFSSSLCCPSGVRIYRTTLTTLRVYWRSTPGPSHATQVNMTGTAHDYSCSAPAGVNFCDINPVQCGDEYTVVVAPVKADGSPEKFCPHRKYGVTCIGGTVGTILFRGKRSLE